MNNKTSHLFVSLLAVLTLIIGAMLPQPVDAQNIYTLTIKVTNFAGAATDLLNIILYEEILDGNPKQVDIISQLDGTDTYEYELTFEYSSSGGPLTATAKYEPYSFTTVPVTCDHNNFTCTAPDITPVTRTISGTVYKPNGSTWQNFALTIIRDLDGTQIITPINTNSSGFYTSSAYDSENVKIIPDPLEGYTFKIIDDIGIAKDPPWEKTPPLGKDYIVNIESQGTRSISGQLDGSGIYNQCIVGATVKAESPNGVSGSAVTDSQGKFSINNLEPVSDYSLTVTYPNTNDCDTTSLSNLNLTAGDLSVTIPLGETSSITGKVMANMRLVMPQLVGNTYVNQYGEDNPTTPLAYYLLANYTTNGGFVYQSSIDWLSGSYRIDNVPMFKSSGKSGTVEITRVGGPAAFGYESGYNNDPNCNLNGFYPKSKCDLTNVGTIKEVRQDFLLTPNRILSGTIIGQSVTPIQRGAIVTFGEGLYWKSPGVLNNAGTAANNFAGSTSTAFNILAQPRIYYLQPVEAGGIITGFAAAGMNRKLVNLTSTNSTGNVFTVNLRIGTISGCLETEYGESPVIPSTTASLRLRPDTVPSGTANTFAGTITPTDSKCNNYPSYTIPNVPYGVVGTFEFDNHTAIGNNRRIADPFNGNISNRKLIVQGDRSLVGKIYSAFNQASGILNPAVNFDLKNNLAISGLSGIFTPSILTNESLKEFEIPNLERRNYTLSYLGNIEGFDVVSSTFTAPINLAANLSANAMVDIPLLAYHKPIELLVNPGTNLGSDGYTHGTGPIPISWAPPEANSNDPVDKYELQVGNIPKTAFTETNPTPVIVPHDPTLNEIQVEYSNILTGQIYWYRVRPVFKYDKGPWSSATVNSADRSTSTGFSPTPGFGWRYFTTPPNLTSPANGASIGTATQVTLTWAAMANTASLSPAPILAYRVDLLRNIDPDDYISSVCVNTTSRLFTGLTTPGTYYWRVQAFKYTGSFTAGTCSDGSCSTGSCLDINKFTEVSTERTFIKQ